MDKLAKRFGLFFLLYLGLMFFSQIKTVQEVHLAYYCQVGDRVFNMINPNLFVTFTKGAPENDKNWNTTIALYNRDKHEGRGKLRNAKYRNSVNPNRLMYRNLYELILLPTFFLLALFVVTPLMNWKKKILYFFICLIILYIFLSFHYSHIFENLVMNNDTIGPTFWHKFVSVFGFRGLTEPLYLIALVSWAIFAFRSEARKFLQ